MPNPGVFDSVDYPYPIGYAGHLGLPVWILSFLQSIIRLWRIEFMSGRDKIISKEIGRGIFQGNSLSLFLFVWGINVLSQRLNGMRPKGLYRRTT